MRVEPDHLEQEILDHLVVEFRGFGERAVSYLNSARAMLELGLDRFPRGPETLCYCLREALKAITNSEDRGGGGEWKKISRAVVEAKTRFDLASEGLPGQDPDAALGALSRAIDEMKRFHEGDGVHQANLIAVIVNRTGSMPHETGNWLVDAYQKVLAEADRRAHGTCTPGRALEIYDEATQVLRRVFAPPEIRHAGLEHLAAVVDPTDADLTELISNVLTGQHWQHFLRHLPTPGWLALLGKTALIDPPATYDGWPGHAAVDALGLRYPDEVAQWLTTIYNRCRSDPIRANYLMRAAVDTGPSGRTLILRALRDHPTDPGVRATANWVLDSVDPPDAFTEELCDILLTPGSDEPWTLGHVASRLVDGITPENATSRLTLIRYKLAALDEDGYGWRYFSLDQTGSIAERDLERREDKFDVLLAAFVAAARAVQEHHGYKAVLEVADGLPDVIRTRVRAWMLGTDDTVDLTEILAELTAAIAVRDPSGDDLPMVDRVVSDLPPDAYRQALSDALGTPPALEDVGRAIKTHDLDPNWLRGYHWIGLLPDAVHRPWTIAYETIASAYGRAGRAQLVSRPRVDASWGRSPFTSKQLNDFDAVEAAARVAAWRPNDAEFLVGARELARAVDAAVQAEPAKWLAEPYRVAMTLHEPSYISHFLLGAAKAIVEVGCAPVGQLMDVLRIIGEHPWEPTPLGSDRFDYDTNWRGAEVQGIALLRVLANADLGFDSRDDEAYELIAAAIANRSDGSGIDSQTDPLTAAINRPTTQALQALIAFMGYEHRRDGAARPAAFELLDSVLRLGGTDGLHYRAIIASRFGYFIATAPEWVEANANLLFGGEAPDDLGQATMDLTLKWSQTLRWVMENRMAQVLDAAAREVDEALTHMLIAYLWETDGYTVEKVIKFLAARPGMLTRAGEELGRLARELEPGEHLTRAMTLWDAALAENTQESRAGFGWFSEVKALDDDEWAGRTLRTIELSKGRVDWVHGIITRAHEMAPTATTLSIFSEVIRHAEQDWDRREAARLGAEHLIAASGLAETAEFQRLNTALRERGL